MKKHCTAIILAAGSGRRMNSPLAKQFIPLLGKPMLWYSLHTIEESGIIDDCIVVTGERDIEYVREKIIAEYGFGKVIAVVSGGSERWESVANAILWLKETKRITSGCDDSLILIHDGARPFVDEAIIMRTVEAAVQSRASVAAVPSKDTIRLSDGQEFAISTPDRKTVWIVQTPQVFDKTLLIKAYDKLQEQVTREGKKSITVIDDAGVVELFMKCPVKLVEGSYRNIKITTPEDMKIASALLAEVSERSR